MKTFKVIVAIAVVIGIFAAVKIVVFNNTGEVNPAVPSGLPKSPVNVYIVKVQELNNNVYATGTIIANEEVTLLPEIAGKIIFLNIKEGSTVQKGELLVKINDADFQAQLKKMELQLKFLEEKLNRLKQLLVINGISQEEYDLNLNLVNTAKADIEYTKAQIAKTEIHAPFNGVMGLRYVSEGSMINASTKIASIQQINQVKIDFSIPEKYAVVLSEKETISFTVSGSDQKYSAKVYAIEPKIDQATRTIQLRALADNAKGDLFPGVFVKIELPLRKIANALMVPTEAIIPILKGKKVFICKNGKAQEVLVETGIRTDDQIQITNGLAEGDSVITTGIMQLKQGMPVKTVKANTTN